MTLLDTILARAVELEASDVHLKEGGCPVFRVAGELITAKEPVLSADELAAMVAQLLPSLGAEEFERLREADASYQTEETGRFRANAYRQRGSTSLALRRVKLEIPGFEELMLPVETMKRIASAQRGLILLCGTTGSGKSTTLAAMLRHMNETTSRHIVTIEDPIEFLFRDDQCVIEQREIGIDTRDYPTALRQVMRQDPDVIVIGEMRDAESFRAGLSAADTGHLVLATMHAENARQVVERVLDFFAATERHQVRRQLGMAIRAIVTQRLVSTGHGNRLPALEILRSNETVRKLFATDQLHLLKTAMTQGTHDGMQTFDQGLLKFVSERRITEEVALTCAEEPEALRMNLRGIFASESKILT